MEQLISTLVKYCHLLEEAQSPRVAQWQPEWLEKCSEWCLYLENELLALDIPQREQCRSTAIDRVPNRVPPIPDLLDAHHQFYKVLLINTHTSNDLYWTIITTYAFLSKPKTVLTEDMACMAQKGAVDRTVQELKRILQED